MPRSASQSATRRLGCVSYLNAKPLIEGLTDGADPSVRFDVPARLLADLEAGDVDLALCPVIDYHRAARPLTMVPAGGIGCAGSTLTVRLFSRVPIEQVRAVHADTDSHTSVALLRIVLAEQYGLQPELIAYHAREQVADHRLTASPETMLLIGDKVVTDSPKAIEYPHQLDLGEAWHALTGLPFVFAIWMAPADAPLGDLPAILDAQRRANADQLQTIVDRYAARHGWPRDLALHYLGSVLRYEIDAPALQAIERFGALAAQHGLIAAQRPLNIHKLDNETNRNRTTPRTDRA